MFRSVARGMASVGRALPVLFRDVLGSCAVASIAYGAWLLHEAAGFIAGGVLVLAGVMLASRPPAGPRE